MGSAAAASRAQTCMHVRRPYRPPPPPPRPAHAAAQQRKYGGMIRRGVTCLQPAACRRRQPHPRAACMHDTQCSAVRCGGSHGSDRAARAIGARLRCGGAACGDRWGVVLACLPACMAAYRDRHSRSTSLGWLLVVVVQTRLEFVLPALSATAVRCLRLLLSPVLLDSETESSSSSRHRCVEPRTYARAALAIISYNS